VSPGSDASIETLVVYTVPYKDRRLFAFQRDRSKRPPDVRDLGARVVLARAEAEPTAGIESRLSFRASRGAILK
jgi:hypothetical protein